jgi:hypothetical protein
VREINRNRNREIRSWREDVFAHTHTPSMGDWDRALSGKPQ